MHCHRHRGWTVRVGPGIPSLPQRLEVYRVLNEEQDYRKEAGSATVTVGEGINVFPARIPVNSYTGYLALYGPGGTFACNPAPQLAGSFEGSAAVGETRRVNTSIGIGVPLTATVEEDRDGDGYGDETQDKCPQSAAFQGECPTTATAATLRIDDDAKAKAILVTARVDSQAEVDVYGQVGWGFKPKPDLKTAGDKPTRLIIGLATPRPKTVAAGAKATFRVPLPKSVLRRLSRLNPRQSITAKLTASATNLAGLVTKGAIVRQAEWPTGHIGGETMRKGIGAVIAVALVSLTGAANASAFTEVGNNCAANSSIAAPVTVFQLGEAAGNPLPLAFPAGGVVTKWRVNTIAPVGGISEKLKVLRGTPDNSQVVGESAVESLTATQNVFETRIPVQAGDRLGVYGPSGFFLCTGGGGDVMGAYAGDVPVGSNGGPATGPVPGRLAVSAFLEPDADGDQYGDETQDRCPQNSNVHTACPQPLPTIALDAFPIVLKRSVLVLVSASSSSAVHVFGQVGWKAKPQGRSRSSKAKPGGGPATTGLVVGLTGGTQTVNPGEVANFNVKLPKSVKRRLGQIPPSKSLKAQLTASTTDLAGRVSTSVLTVKLPGQDRR